MLESELIVIIQQAVEQGEKKLDLSNRGIIKLPDEIGLLTELEGLNLADNNLTELPTSFRNLTKLSFLNLNGNLIQYPDGYLFKQIDKVVFDWSRLECLEFEYFYNIQTLSRKKDGSFLLNMLQFQENVAPQLLLNFILKTKDKFRFRLNLNAVILQWKEGVIFKSEGLGILINIKDNLVGYNNIGVYVAGEYHKSVKILGEIRKCFDEVHSSENLNVNSDVYRFFYYSANKERFRIIYDSIVATKKMYRETYLINNVLFDVNELLNYIDGSSDIEYDTAYLKKEFYSKTNQDFLTKVQIQSFKIFDDIQVSLSKNVNVILGRNGFGKTSLLQAIALGLSSTKGQDRIGNFEKLIAIGKHKSDILVNWGNYTRKVWVYQKELQEERLSYLPQPILLGYGANIFHNRDFEYESMAENLVLGNGKNHSIESLFNKFSDKFYNPLKILEWLKNDAKRLYPKHKKIVEDIEQLIFNTLNDFLRLNDIASTDTNESIQIVENQGLFFFKKTNQSSLQLFHLSEGYRAHLLIITDILLRITGARNSLKIKNLKVDNGFLKHARGAILIDEFDRHLHPVWQRKLLNKLREVFSNIQFIVTTHNPMAILGRKAEEITELIMDEKGNIIVKSYQNGTNHVDAGTLLLTHFGLNSIVSTAMQQKIQRFHELKTEGERTNELEELEAELEKSLVGKVIHDYRYWTFLKFLQKHGFDTRKKIEEIDLSKKELGELEAEFKAYL